MQCWSRFNFSRFSRLSRFWVPEVLKRRMWCGCFPNPSWFQSIQCGTPQPATCTFAAPNSNTHLAVLPLAVDRGYPNQHASTCKPDRTRTTQTDTEVQFVSCLMTTMPPRSAGFQQNALAACGSFCESYSPTPKRTNVADIALSGEPKSQIGFWPLRHDGQALARKVVRGSSHSSPLCGPGHDLTRPGSWS